MGFTVTSVYPHTFWYRWRNRLTLWRTKPLYTLKARAALVTVTMAKAGGQADPTNASPINFTVTFSAAVTGFDNGDLYPGGTTAQGNYTTVITGGPAVYNVAMSGMTPGVGGGVVGPGVNAFAGQAASGSVSAASNVATVAYNG